MSDEIERLRAEIERLRAELAAERERCVQVVFSLIEDGDEAEECAAAIRKGTNFLCR